MALENRDVRPFRDLHVVQTWLEEHLKLEVRASASNEVVCVDAGSTSRLDPATLATCGHRLVVSEGVSTKEVEASVKSFAEELGLEDPESLQVVVLATSRFLAFTDELVRFPAGRLDNFTAGVDLIHDGSPRPRSLSLPHNGSIVEVVVVLSEELTPKLGWPHRLGTWLARVRFSLANPEEGIGFNPLPLTDEKRKELELGRHVVHFPKVSEFQPDILMATMLDDYVEYYVDSDLLARLSAHPRHAQSELHQTEMFLGAVTFVVMQFQKVVGIDDLTFADVDETLIGKVVRIVADETPKSLNGSFDVLKSSPSQFVAQVEDVIRYKQRLDASLSGLGGR